MLATLMTAVVSTVSVVLFQLDSEYLIPCSECNKVITSVTAYEKDSRFRVRSRCRINTHVSCLHLDLQANDGTATDVYAQYSDSQSKGYHTDVCVPFTSVHSKGTRTNVYVQFFVVVCFF